MDSQELAGGNFLGASFVRARRHLHRGAETGAPDHVISVPATKLIWSMDLRRGTPHGGVSMTVTDQLLAHNETYAPSPGDLAIPDKVAVIACMDAR